MLCNFIEITLRHGCSHVNLLHIFRTHSPKNTSEWLLLNFTFSNIEAWKSVTLLQANHFKTDLQRILSKFLFISYNF